MQSISPGKNALPLVTALEDALLALNRIAARRLFQDCGLSALQFAETVVVPALERIGNAWEKGSVALSQVYMSGRICEDLMDQYLSVGDGADCEHPAMALAVLNDTHLLGKRMVGSVMRGSGFRITDYGQVQLDELIARVERDRIRLLMVSVLMLNSALQVRELKKGLESKGLDVKLVVGGAPFRFDPSLVSEVGADATSPTASGVVEVVRGLLGAMGWTT